MYSSSQAICPVLPEALAALVVGGCLRSPVRFTSLPCMSTVPSSFDCTKALPVVFDIPSTLLLSLILLACILSPVAGASLNVSVVPDTV